MLNFAFNVLLVLAGSSTVLSAPAPAAITDTDILQYALTLEHLENAFYSGALEKFDEQAFADAGFDSWVHGRFVQIGQHEAEHVEFLKTALGSAATQPCTYNFPYTDPISFAALSMALESVGTSAYLGAAQDISDKGALTAAGAILTTEARHAGWVSSAVLREQPWNGPLETPLGLDAVYSLAAQFIVECPATNPALPVKTFPALIVSNTSPKSGSTITVTHSNQQNVMPEYMSWFNGLNVIYTPIEDGSTQVPQGLAGTVYAGAVSSNSNPPSDSTMLSGLAIFQFAFSSSVV
ncbi:Protein rds1 [Grifola frondosa]|uniref:Protein rds1 n=1 Tax=Grifola frondosa TaxID=5627 RepID=A0A1C7MJ89_GRIFR|nr:Protein rds1 [Grifola frondosa]